MLNMFYRALGNKKGFTLIEVLVVVAIIAILSAIAAPLILGQMDKARIASDQSLASSLQTALDIYLIEEDLRREPGEELVKPTTFAPFCTEDYLDAKTRDALPTNLGVTSFTGRIWNIVFDPTLLTVTAVNPDEAGGGGATD